MNFTDPVPESRNDLLDLADFHIEQARDDMSRSYDRDSLDVHARMCAQQATANAAIAQALIARAAHVGPETVPAPRFLMVEERS